MSETGKAKLQALWDGIKTAAQDLTTLEVTTLSGEITSILTEKLEPGKSFFKDSGAIFSALKPTTGETNAKINVIAFTRIDFDQDTVNFVAKDLTENDKAIYQVHLDSVKAATEARAAFINMLVNAFPK